MIAASLVRLVVALRGVSKSFSRDGDATPVLCGVNLELGSGDKASLVGPSGSGKSTLLSLMAGLLRPDSGSVEVNGTAIENLGDNQRAGIRARHIGIALQADNLIPFLSARENVELALGFGARNGSGHRARSAEGERALNLLARFGVAHRADHRPRHLSGGEAQRVALAVSAVNDPEVLLADEIVAGLDGDTAGRVIDEVLDASFALLYVTHDVALADRAERRFTVDDRSVHPR